MGLVLLVEITFGIIFILILFYKYITSNYDYWRNRNVPYLEPSFPFGNIKELITNKIYVGNCYKNLYDQMPGEKYFGIFELRQPTLILRDLSLIKNILATDFQHFSDRGFIHEDIKTDFLASKHLFNLKNDSWKNMRLKMTPTFTLARVKSMYGLMEKCSRQLDNYFDMVVEYNETVEMKDLMSRFTSDCVSSCLFGMETNAIFEKDSEVRRIWKSLFSNSKWFMVKLMMSINHPRIFNLLKLEMAPQDVKEFCLKVARDTYTYRLKHNIYRNDFIDLLIKIKQNKNLYEDEKNNAQEERTFGNGDNGLSFEEMAAQIFLMFLAGFETSSSATTFTLYELWKHPHVLSKVVDEMDKVLSEHGKQITYQALSDMVYLEQAIHETLRLYPAASLLTRKCTRTYQVPGSNLVVEKGTRIIIPALAINYDGNYYPQPLNYDPDRFNPEGGNKSRNQGLDFSFGYGPMSCIGTRFGLMQVKCALVTLLSKYKLLEIPETPKQITLDPTQYLQEPLEDICFKIVKRTD